MATERKAAWRYADTLMLYGELAVYVVIAIVLVAGAAVVLVQTIASFIDHIDEGVVAAATELLSTLLLVFVFVELVGAVRMIIRERRLLAEPFLLVGIIASIKEIVVVAGAETTPTDDFEQFRNAMIEIGVLAGVILVLAVSALLLRLREREPAEETS